jgi:hypothetical protein
VKNEELKIWCLKKKLLPRKQTGKLKASLLVKIPDSKPQK